MYEAVSKATNGSSLDVRVVSGNFVSTAVRVLSIILIAISGIKGIMSSELASGLFYYSSGAPACHHSKAK